MRSIQHFAICRCCSFIVSMYREPLERRHVSLLRIPALPYITHGSHLALAWLSLTTQANNKYFLEWSGVECCLSMSTTSIKLISQCSRSMYVGVFCSDLSFTLELILEKSPECNLLTLDYSLWNTIYTIYMDSYLHNCVHVFQLLFIPFSKIHTFIKIPI